MAKAIQYQDAFQKGYQYLLTEPTGKNFDQAFTPDLTPAEMLRLGVFGGAYFIGVRGLIPADLPRAWFKGAALSSNEKKHAELNYYKINASQPLSVWRQKGWVHPDDPHGWFQWYCRYYLGRRLPEEDKRQIKRWRAYRRHWVQVANNCMPGDDTCRAKQRQSLLHWAYDSRKI